MTVLLPASLARELVDRQIDRDYPESDEDPRWRARAACHKAPPELFITKGDDDDDPTYPPPEAEAYCAICPVKAECLEYALRHTTATHRVVGVWGGYTEFQREQLRRRRERVRCPDPRCGSTIIIKEAGGELCLACGLSWRTW